METVIHRFINSEGFEIIVPRVIDEYYQRTVDLMHQQGPHGGIVKEVVWKTTDPNYEWTEEVYANLSSLIIVKEHIKAKDRFGKKITLRDHECALFDYIQGCGSTGKYAQMKNGAEALIAIKPDTRSIFQFEN